MINELTVLRKLKQVIEEQLNTYITASPESAVLSTISSANVALEFPTVDQMPATVMFYIQPNSAQYEALSTESDNSDFNVNVFILCKRDNRANLTTKIYGYFNCLYSLIRNNISLDSTVDFVTITDSQFYPAVEGNQNVQGTECVLSIRYTKDY